MAQTLRKDSAFPSSSSLSSIAQPKCSEYFHDYEAAVSETHECVGKYHTQTHYVCKTCIDTSSAWTYKSDDRSHPPCESPAILTEIWRALCQPCMKAAQSLSGNYRIGCHCADEWRCFECRDVIAFRGFAADGDIAYIEAKKKKWIRELRQEDKPIPCNKTSLCPGCETWFHCLIRQDHAHMCMGCKGIVFGEETASQHQETAERLCAPLQSPNWGSAAPSNRYNALIDETIAPDEQPSARLAISGSQTDEFTYDLSPSNKLTIVEWNFPRSGAVKVGLQPQDIDAASNLETRNYLRDQIAYDSSRCLICGTEDHGTYYCHQIHEVTTESARFYAHLVDTTNEDRELTRELEKRQPQPDAETVARRAREKAEWQEREEFEYWLSVEEERREMAEQILVEEEQKRMVETTRDELIQDPGRSARRSRCWPL